MTVDPQSFTIILQSQQADDEAVACRGFPQLAAVQPARVLVVSDGEATPWRDDLVDLLTTQLGSATAAGVRPCAGPGGVGCWATQEPGVRNLLVVVAGEQAPSAVLNLQRPCSIYLNARSWRQGVADLLDRMDHYVVYVSSITESVLWELGQLDTDERRRRVTVVFDEETIDKKEGQLALQDAMQARYRRAADLVQGGPATRPHRHRAAGPTVPEIPGHYVR